MGFTFEWQVIDSRLEHWKSQRVSGGHKVVVEIEKYLYDRRLDHGRSWLVAVVFLFYTGDRLPSHGNEAEL